MTVTIGRRELLVALGGMAAAWPLAARAQQPATPVIEPQVSRRDGAACGRVQAGPELYENGLPVGWPTRTVMFCPALW
jgi:hypothetical protein